MPKTLTATHATSVDLSTVANAGGNLTAAGGSADANGGGSRAKPIPPSLICIHTAI